MIPAVTMLPRSASRQSHRRPGDGRITSHSRVRSHVARGASSGAMNEQRTRIPPWALGWSSPRSRVMSAGAAPIPMIRSSPPDSAPSRGSPEAGLVTTGTTLPWRCAPHER